MTHDDFLTCTAGHSVPAGNAVDTAQGMRCPIRNCGALCDEQRPPGEVLPGCYLSEVAALRLPQVKADALTWDEIGRRFYIINVNRRHYTGGENFSTDDFIMRASAVPLHLRCSEAAALKRGYDAERHAWNCPDPADCYGSQEPVDAPYECIECGAADPFEPLKPHCACCYISAGEIIEAAERRAGWDPNP